MAAAPILKHALTIVVDGDINNDGFPNLVGADGGDSIVLQDVHLIFLRCDGCGGMTRVDRFRLLTAH
jgi:hypothetical protein